MAAVSFTPSTGVLTGAIAVSLAGMAGIAGYFVFRKKKPGSGIQTKGGKDRSIDDIPLDEIEMPWHQW